MRGAFVMVVALAEMGCGSSTTTERIGAEPAAKDDAGNTVLADGGKLSPDGGVVGPDGGVVAPGADPVEQSGSRLKVKTITGSDGSRLSTGLRDTQLNVDCAFVASTDGTTRCLPWTFNVTASSYFPDATCAAPLLWTAKACSGNVSYAIDQGPAAACAVAYRVRSVGAAYTGTLYQGTPGACTAVGAANQTNIYSSRDFYAAGAEVPPSAFVAGTAGLQ